MNQSILFPDIQQWDEQSAQITFPAQQSGALIECVISKAKLEQLSGQSIQGEAQALQVFSELRFDLEELAEEYIEDEEFNSEGQAELG
ncbi:DUF1488 domain-containing protein [Vibrio sp. SCSIO 43136]|uniref:DUF1488 domain-containing protein n=1 Tax=Vibrio sp. SCSIO 43136 TaxID=2819101 RepID=UPI0020758A48|nr:DUF1488 domain-containing protein [Vibrio sp. SCSIO 43136]USD65338.1 DUF1488 domain-containing protein [Vibrio sp. SCSIO 43136]